MMPQDSPAPRDTATNADSQSHMRGDGFYREHSEEQGAANRLGLGLLVEAVGAIDVERTAGGFHIADYGSAHGRNSLLPMRTVIEAVKERWDPVPPITVTHTDLPSNDWTTLFETVGESPDSYLAGESNVFAFACGASVYVQSFPPEHIALGYSAIVEHWLSRRPGDLPNHIWSTRAAGEAREVWAAQARSDWREFLHFRAVELIPSGRLVLVASGADAQGDSGAEPLLDLADEVLRAMVDAGELPADAYAAMAIPTWYRAEPEWREPFEDADFLRGNPLRLLSYRELSMEDVYLAQYERTGDAEAFGRDAAAFFLAAFEPVLFAPLGAERLRVVETFTTRLQTALALEPRNCAARWRLAIMSIARS